MNKDLIMVTGGAGFIGSAVVRKFIDETAFTVVNVDKLTYAGNLSSLGQARFSDRHQFEKVDICDTAGVRRVIEQYQPRLLMHLAAESHVDRSIDGPGDFITTNIVGTYTLLEAAREYWAGLPDGDRQRFKFHHISTDEVYGSLASEGLFTETTPYRPNSPYSASKAASDHLVRAWGRTYGLPTVISNCSNNYGPYQYPEKLIPLIIHKALAEQTLPVYGKGDNVRDWLYVDDHADALITIAERGAVGEVYNVGGLNEKTNLEVVHELCRILDELRPRAGGSSYAELINFVADRPGHDFRYAIDAGKIERDLGWTPRETFASGLRKTVLWYLDNELWCQGLRQHYHGERLGVGGPR